IRSLVVADGTAGVQRDVAGADEDTAAVSTGPVVHDAAGRERQPLARPDAAALVGGAVEVRGRAGDAVFEHHVARRVDAAAVALHARHGGGAVALDVDVVQGQVGKGAVDENAAAVAASGRPAVEGDDTAGADAGDGHVGGAGADVEHPRVRRRLV